MNGLIKPSVTLVLHSIVWVVLESEAILSCVSAVAEKLKRPMCLSELK